MRSSSSPAAFRADGGHVAAQFRLWDIATANRSRDSNIRPTATTRGESPISSPTRMFTRITGEKGFFDTRVVFVDETGPKEKRRKRLAIMDMDGADMNI